MSETVYPTEREAIRYRQRYQPRGAKLAKPSDTASAIAQALEGPDARSDRRSRNMKAVLMSERCVKACGKVPS